MVRLRSVYFQDLIAYLLNSARLLLGFAITWVDALGQHDGVKRLDEGTGRRIVTFPVTNLRHSLLTHVLKSLVDHRHLK